MSRRRIALLVFAGVAAYVIALVASAPASWLAYAIARASDGVIELREPAGSLWSGSGRLYARAQADSLLDLGGMRWNTSWSEIHRLRLGVSLALGGAQRPAEIQLSPSGVSVRRLSVAVPAEVITGFVPALEGLGPMGTLRVRTEDLRVERDSVLGQAEVEWAQVRLARSPDLEFGSHIARLRGSGPRVVIELSSLGGPLRLSGTGTWSREAGLVLSGAAEHDAQQGSAMAVFLQGMCSTYRANRCEFRVRR